MMGIEENEMAKSLEITVDKYKEYETGERDFSFTFLYKCSELLNVDIVEILTGTNPKLSIYSIDRAGKGLDIKRREGLIYEHLGYRFKGKTSEPFLVTAPVIKEEQEKPIKLSAHEGQEFDYVIKGSLKVQVGEHIEILNAGDSIYYDSSYGHGMIAIGEEDCIFIAMVMKKEKEGSDA
jgi:mannose-6-phosphate isomerase-like protein (cupin superfamily)